MNATFDSPEAVNSILDHLASSMYYDEDHQVHWEAKRLLGEMSDDQLSMFKAAFLKRLYADPNIANIFLAGSFEVSEAAPFIAEKLGEQQDSTLLTRTILHVLGQLGGDEAYRAMVPYLDSSFEQEALRFLAQIDFPRTIPHLRRGLMIDGLLQSCLHIFHARRNQSDLDTLKRDLSILLDGDGGRLRTRIEHAFSIQDDPYNPFNRDERKDILQTLA